MIEGKQRVRSRVGEGREVQDRPRMWRNWPEEGDEMATSVVEVVLGRSYSLMIVVMNVVGSTAA